MHYAVTIDVPSLERGLKFYRDAMGFAEVSRPVETYVVLQCGGAKIGLIEKSPGTSPAEGADDVRRYERHWTPVHIDFHVEDFEAVLARALEAGARCERRFAGGPHPPVAFCSDPFGNGFCIVGTMVKG
ncbi:MAG TPA: VOC family protein [Rhizomicrobium sp.]|jgi:catechol 2,3-dioxygenase-like lactoylglutathione lyase family enzyme|nr:VOC family protein [Rhizomicrobium sp.]